MKAFVTVFLLFASLARADALEGLQLDRMNLAAPALSIASESGQRKELKDFLGHPLLLHVWAAWCATCKRELPSLAQASKKWAKSGVGFLAVSVDKASPLPFFKSLKIDLPYWSSVSDEQSKPYWAWGLPITYWIDANGQIVARALGERDWSKVSGEELSRFFKTGK